MMNLFFVLLLGCPKPTPDIDPRLQLQEEKSISAEDESRLQSGTFIDGVFRDKSFPLEGTIHEDWEIDPQERFGSRRFRAIHKEGVVLEIWHFKGIALRPAKYDFCSWDFIDRGYYENTKDKLLISTCFPKNLKSKYVFAYMYHWSGSTWQFEIHVDAQGSITGRRLGEDLLKNFIWRGDEGIPVLRP